MVLSEDVKASGFRIGFSSAGEDREHGTFNIKWFGRSKWYHLKKPWLKPYIHKMMDKETGKFKYDYPMEREFSLSVNLYPEYHIYINYGVEDPGWIDGLKVWGGYKFINFSWMHYRFYSMEHLQQNGKQIYIETDERPLFGKRKFASRVFYPHGFPGQQSVKFRFLDGYDNEEIIVTCKIDRRTWKRGEGWFKWLSWFYNDKVHTDIDMEFNKEVGKRKGSWKGGTIGMGINLTKSVKKPPIVKEDVELAIIAWCSKENHTYLGKVDDFYESILYFPDKLKHEPRQESEDEPQCCALNIKGDSLA